MNYEDIESASEEKDLGVVFQQDLKSSNFHIAEKVNRANSVLSLIVRTFDYLEWLLYTLIQSMHSLDHMLNMGTLYSTHSQIIKL